MRLRVLVDASKDDDQEEEDSVTVGGTRKRRLAGVAISEQDEEVSEAQSESVSVGGQCRSMRRQAAGPSTQAPGEKCYNLRRTTVAKAAPTDKKKAAKTGKKQTVEGTGDDTEGTSKVEERAGSKMACESADGASQLLEFSQAETVEAHAPAGEEYGDVVDGQDAFAEVTPATPSGSELVVEDEIDQSGKRYGLSSRHSKSCQRVFSDD